MDPATGINVEQLIAALQRSGTPLPHEMGTFIVLETCERLLESPRVVGASEIWLNAEGELAVISNRAGDGAVDGGEAGRSLLLLLGELLVRSAPGVPAQLLELVERASSADALELHGLRDELEAALVPLNRGATRRVLSRLLQALARGSGRGPGDGELDGEAIDGELDSVLGLQPGEAPPPPEVQRLKSEAKAVVARGAGAVAQDVSLEEFERVSESGRQRMVRLLLVAVIVGALAVAGYRLVAG
ncbi:MAG: hypothetical protein OEZ06_02790 [Myxococcales bacterium]|nr:hypothetical protein [Myxococcales bacterium]